MTINLLHTAGRRIESESLRSKRCNLTDCQAECITAYLHLITRINTRYYGLHCEPRNAAAETVSATPQPFSPSIVSMFIQTSRMQTSTPCSSGS